MNINAICYGGAAALYAALAGLVLLQARLSRTGLFLAAACLVTALWLGAVVSPMPGPPGLIVGLLEFARSLAWYGFLLHLYHRSVAGKGPMLQAFMVMGAVAVLVVVLSLAMERELAATPVNLFSSGTVLRIGLAVCSILLIENLYLNTPPEGRWHINLPCIGLGAMFCYDIAMAVDTVLFRQVSDAMFTGRAVAAGVVVPLLALGAVRNRRWAVQIHVSRTAAFHTATLIGSGLLLLGLAAVGEAFRYLGASWGGLAEITLVFIGLLAIATVVTSGTARSWLRTLVVDHFFSHRYDWRAEWMRSINTLSASDTFVPLHTRVIRTIAAVVDSPGGALLLREPGAESAAFAWAGSWNMPAVTAPLTAEHRLLAEIAAQGEAAQGGVAVVVRGRPDLLPAGLDQAWLAVPLLHGGRLTGIVVLPGPRAAFKLDGEVFDLLRVIGRQAAAYVAEQNATEVMIEAKALHEYSRRFAFVAHDIKNVSSQLSMLLANAEVHLANPEFQRDMLATVRASVQRISGLLRKLQAPEGEAGPAVTDPAERLRALLATSPRLRQAAVRLEPGGRGCAVTIATAAFDAVVTHLLDNALDAARDAEAAGPVRVAIRREGRQVVVDIVDEGPGMTPEFIRDRLFRPFDTSKRGGSGIGAWQARELLRAAGGDLLALSAVGQGTTMRIMLPAAETAAVSQAADAAG